MTKLGSDDDLKDAIDVCGGEAFVWTDANGRQWPVEVLFDNGYALADIGEGIGVVGTGPEIHLRSIDVAGIAIGQTVKRSSDSIAYTIADVQPDGQGLTKVIMKESA